jgi:hypothetical protein
MVGGNYLEVDLACGMLAAGMKQLIPDTQRKKEKDDHVQHSVQ